MKNTGILLALVLFSSFSSLVFADTTPAPSKSFGVKGTLKAYGYGNVDATGTGTFHISVPSGSSASVTLYNVDTADEIRGDGVDWIVTKTGNMRIWKGSGVLTIVGTNARVSAMGSPKVNVYLSGYGKVTLSGDGKYSASGKLHDVVLGVSAPGTVTASKSFDAKIVLNNKGSYTESVTSVWKFTSLDASESCDKEGSSAVDLAKGSSKIVLVPLTVSEQCVGKYVFEASASAKSRDAYSTDNTAQTSVLVLKAGSPTPTPTATPTATPTPTLDASITKVWVTPSSVYLGDKFTASVSLKNKLGGNVSLVLSSSLSPRSQSCANTALAPVTVNLNPNQELVYTYRDLSLSTCPGDYDFLAVADVVGGDVYPSDNSGQSAFKLLSKIHSAGVTGITVPSEVDLDEEFSATVTVTNKGNFDETVSLNSVINPLADTTGTCSKIPTQQVSLKVLAGKSASYTYKDLSVGSCSGPHEFVAEISGFTESQGESSADNVLSKGFTVSKARDLGNPGNTNPNN